MAWLSRRKAIIGLLGGALLITPSCSPLPKLSLTPVSAEATIGGEHETGVEEDNMVKVQTGDTSQTEYIADTVTQAYNDIQEYPLWLILAFALTLPSPLSSFQGWRERKRLTKQIDKLTESLAVSQPAQKEE
jgi:hypothetical protein